MVGRGATVLMRKFGSIVGTSVWVSAGGVEVREAESATGGARSVPVGVQGIGWKGVGVGEAFGADVTRAKGKACCSMGALLPHPASSKAAMIESRQKSFIAKGFELGMA